MTVWVYRPGHPRANANGMVDRDLVDNPPRPSLYVMSDLAGYKSPLGTGWIEGRAARREDLKRGNCREVDPSERPQQRPRPEIDIRPIVRD